MVIKFGTDGWRAVMAEDFTFANCRVVAQGIAAYVNSRNMAKKGIVIGYDNRFMSERFALECGKVLAGNGIKVYMGKRAMPTPVTAFAIRALDAAGAVMITASHNPPEYNGIKFIPEYAGPAMPDVTDVIEQQVKKVLETGKVYELSVVEAERLELWQEIDMEDAYAEHVLSLIHKESFSRPLKVVVDPMYGAGIGYLDRILEGLGCEVRTVNNYRDPLFGGSMPEPIDRMLGSLKRAVAAYEADVGLALDGDADRFGVVDNEGQFVTANQLMYLLLLHLLKTRSYKGPIARTVATTHMLDRIAKRFGLAVIETPVGFKYIGECLREKGCLLGGEESGGLSIFGHVPEKDGILACLLAAEMLAASGKTVSQLKAEVEKEYGMLVSRRIDIKVKEHEKAQIITRLAEYTPKTVADIKVESINTVDGKKVVLEDGSWFLVRASGTEPLFRIYLETAEEEKMAKIEEEVLKALEIEFF
ncbi:phosphoglucomutase, alpha-D-glucose phosphate-specific [Thermosyntropha lipolytica DSM 11003]|uniref:Phosphoglucomutase n=1 Tax=Thermosyntropha lipolytica DSM 11003 TaxID=1123382 RepID=A0A1M5Q5P9_9FIRM|nr:phosphoglucomutase/phosphomannomutase family protein [Thermosyntropha lipolytica]SHH09577.1 phosphoglucomutase, alpha-D-glucose phosphate-specific [Thermosyntropha lipolytica DSM 11003]